MTENIIEVPADQRQVGGNHYNSSIQHWDLIERYGIGYLEGCATKYVFRARKKNGLQDVQKAQHYVQKLIELYEEGVRIPRGVVPLSKMAQFYDANPELSALENSIIYLLCTWTTGSHLKAAMKDLVDLEEELANTQGA